MLKFYLKLVPAAALLGLSFLLSGCNEPGPAAASEEKKAPEVGIVTVQEHARTITHELPGRIASMRVADVRPRVSGILTERLFHQGSDVKANEALYQIDRRPFEIELRASEAALAKAEASLELAKQHEQRVATLAAQRIASKAEQEKAVATMREAEADTAARKADVDRAKLNLDYTTIRAPIGGRIGAAIVSEGALVVQNDTSSLAKIQQLDPIYADFTQSVGDLNKMRHALERGDLERIAADVAKVRLIFDDGTAYSLPGKLLFSEAKVDAETGQVTLRGEFANPKRELLPGMYVRVRIEQGIDSDAIAIPQQAVQRDAGGTAKVFVVAADGTTSLRRIRTGSIQDGQWLVLDGLKPGERVVVDGFQKFTPGDRVDPKPWTEADSRPQGNKG
ncbi:efflux RND transporter periplasmic adaptor subunit [Methyloferula stellata]|uniref:efflux RND transporter periplasmic adaptor subunit n=1 Tax=Methyloferula stellata TaxID=876270 RepID=UPI00035ED503|nr:efflux RND transporter periplasmic adaptor subunit [Methyloferula stellata]